MKRATTAAVMVGLAVACSTGPSEAEVAACAELREVSSAFDKHLDEGRQSVVTFAVVGVSVTDFVAAANRTEGADLAQAGGAVGRTWEQVRLNTRPREPEMGPAEEEALDAFVTAFFDAVDTCDSVGVPVELPE